MTFSVATPSQDTRPEAASSPKITFKVKKRSKLFPTVIITPSTEKIVDLDFTPDLFCHSIASTLTPPHTKTKLSPCPPRFKLMALSPCHWVRQPFKSVPYTSAPTADGALQIQSHKEPSYCIYATLPEEDLVMNLLELSEHKKLLKFHICSLEAYTAMSSHCNCNISSKLSEIFDTRQLLHCLKLKGMDFSLRAAYIHLVNSLHLELEVQNKVMTRGEYIIPLSKCLHTTPLFSVPSQHLKQSVFQLAMAPLLELDPALKNQAAISHNISSCFSPAMEGKLHRFSFSLYELNEIVFRNLEKLLSTK